MLTGSSTHCYVPKFADPISIKAVAYGEVAWRLDQRRYLIRPDTLLLLPDGDEYSLTIDSVQPSRGFCVLFRRGLVEESWRAAVSKDETLLDAPHDVRPLPFRRRLESRSGPVGRALDALAAAVEARASPDTVGWLFEALGERAAASVCEQRREHRRLTAVRPATRLEIHRRLDRAREAVEDVFVPIFLLLLTGVGAWWGVPPGVLTADSVPTIIIQVVFAVYLLAMLRRVYHVSRWYGGLLAASIAWSFFHIVWLFRLCVFVVTIRLLQ